MKKQLASLQNAQRKKEEADGYQEMSKKLDAANAVFIKQKFDFMEMLTGCDMNNKYDVFRMENGKPVGAPLFRWTESSSCFQRNCMSADCRQMDMKVTNLHHINQNLNQEVMSILRPCKMTIACFNRQEIQVQWVEGGERKFIGKIVDPWDCCNFSFRIQDEKAQEMYTVVASCCQLAFHCKQFPCEACQTVKFTIHEPGHDAEIGSMVKVGNGCCVNSLDLGYNNFKIEFPKGANWKQKALLINCAVFIDYMMFEDKSKKEKGEVTISV